MLGDRGRVVRALHAHERRRVGRRGDDDRAREAVLAEDVLDEFLDLAAALADQADDDDVGRGVARHHAEQHALADAGAGEQADALAAADGEHRVDRAHAGVEHLRDRRAVERDSEDGCGAIRCDRLERAETVEWSARAVEHTPE